MTIARKIPLYFVILISGGCTMVFEIVTPRLFAPYFGTSTYIWTIVIGVVMASLSLGYFLGGKLADVKPKLSSITALLLAAGVFAYIISLSKDILINIGYVKLHNMLGEALVVSLAMLAPINILLGMITPLAVRLLTLNKNSSGSVAGNVYAVSTVGSILGTFSAGFWFIPAFGVHKILFGVSVALIICAAISAISGYIKAFSFFLLVFFSFGYFYYNPKEVFANYFENIFGVDLLADFDTEYNRIWIYDKDVGTNNHKRVLADSQSSLYLTKPFKELTVSELSYFGKFNLAYYYKEKIREALMLGGGGYFYASYLLATDSDLNLDVVEIDPVLLAVAEKYFNFSPSKRFQNYPIDGRVFLNNNQKKYDVIFLDVYRNGSSMPFQLTTKEAFGLMYNALNENGLLFINIIASVNGKGSELFQAQYRTVNSVFDGVKVFPVKSEDPNIFQNIVLMAFKGTDAYKLKPGGMDIKTYMGDGNIMSDDYAPVEYYDLKKIL